MVRAKWAGFTCAVVWIGITIASYGRGIPSAGQMWVLMGGSIAVLFGVGLAIRDKALTKGVSDVIVLTILSLLATTVFLVVLPASTGMTFDVEGSRLAGQVPCWMPKPFWAAHLVTLPSLSQEVEVTVKIPANNGGTLRIPARVLLPLEYSRVWDLERIRTNPARISHKQIGIEFSRMLSRAASEELEVKEVLIPNLITGKEKQMLVLDDHTFSAVRDSFFEGSRRLIQEWCRENGFAVPREKQIKILLPHPKPKSGT